MTAEALVMTAGIFPHFFQCTLVRKQICWGRKGQNGKWHKEPLRSLGYKFCVTYLESRRGGAEKWAKQM